MHPFATMKATEAKSIIEAVRAASVGDIAVVSFVVLPILLAAWSVLLSFAGMLPPTPTYRLWLFVALVVLYALAVFVMKRSESAHSRRIRAAKHIRNRLQRRLPPNYGLASFDYIRRRVNDTYTDDFLTKLVEDFPDEFMRMRCKGDRPGLRLIDDDAA